MGWWTAMIVYIFSFSFQRVLCIYSTWDVLFEVWRRLQVSANWITIGSGKDSQAAQNQAISDRYANSCRSFIVIIDGNVVK